jgi:hypothetical protein
LSHCSLLDYLGFQYKPSKNIYPAREVEYIGFVINSEKRHVSITPDRAAKLIDAIDDFEASSNASPPTRRELAGLIGQLQWVAQIAHGGQHHLQACYRARDAFLASDAARWEGMTLTAAARARVQWAAHVRVAVDADVHKELRFWRELLTSRPRRRLYLNNLTVANGFWDGEIAETDEHLDRDGGDGVSAEDVEVFTGDAAGNAGGGWWRTRRMAVPFPLSERAPLKSSNFRELKTALAMLERWGPQLRGRRILVRTDNMTTMKVINKLTTASADLKPLAERIYALATEFDIDVRARHIPGLKNILADRLSRELFLRAGDSGDIMLRRDEFAAIQRMQPRPFDMDACSDALGDNAHCECYFSFLDSCLEHSWKGKSVWCFPETHMIESTLRHFNAHFTSSPTDTSAAFLLPFWPQAPWWRLLRDFRVDAQYAKGAELFTEPGPPAQSQTAVPTRITSAATNYPMVVVSRPPVAYGRGGGATARSWSSGAAGAAARDRSGLERLALRERPLLTGYGSVDQGVVHRMPSRPVSRMRRPVH